MFLSSHNHFNRDISTKTMSITPIIKPVKTMKNPILDLILASKASAINKRKFAINKISVNILFPHNKEIYQTKNY